jgi:hypothetical protein
MIRCLYFTPFMVFRESPLTLHLLLRSFHPQCRCKMVRLIVLVNVIRDDFFANEADVHAYVRIMQGGLCKIRRDYV